MTPERWQQIEALYHAALERSETDRGTFLDQACRGDPELRAEVESLLATHARGADFLEAPAIAVEARTFAEQAPRLATGQRLGPFLVSEMLGAGGMGEVWRARDTALGRDVAIKVLSAAYSSDADRLRRFEQEARAAGQINHPNILTVHAVGSHAGAPYLVTELLEGETLQERLRTGALPVRKAVDIAIQITQGLAAAHERGIVHRDIKPGNLFVTTDGRVKILDFGVAKLTEAGSEGNIQTRNTASAILGTAGYMPPEQIRGQPVDHRADLFALGVVLYEMLSGRRAFSAGSTVETMHQILTADPPPLDEVDPALARIVQHCLEKNRNERFQSARDLAFHLEGARPSSDARTSVGIDRMRASRAVGVYLRRWLPWALAAAASAVAVAALIFGGGGAAPTRDAPLRRFSISMATAPLRADEWPPLAVSPDGRRLAYVTRGDAGAQIVVRDLDSLTARAIPGTENGFAPFFSPDGEHLGFFRSNALMRVALVGGPPARLTITPPVPRGAVWTVDGWIYFAPSQSDGIFRIAADGGAAEPVTRDGAVAKQEGHVWPDVSPDGAILVYVARRGDSFDEARIVARSLRTGSERTIVEGGTCPRVAPDGRVVFARGAVLYTIAIDPVQLTPRGLAQPILNGVQMDPLFGGSYYGIARDGTLVYVPGDARPPGRRLLWVTASGVETAAFPEERPFLYPVISPDGTAVAVTIEGVHQDLWRFDIGRDVLARLTSLASEDFGPVWSPDSRRLAYTSIRQGQEPAVFVKPADRLDGDTHVAASSFPNAWIAEDALIVTTEPGQAAHLRHELAVAPLAGGAPRALAAPRFDRYGATLSPDGRRMAFVSLETGRAEIFVGSPDASDARQASVGGGTSPVWARDGRALFYRNGDAVMSVAVGDGQRPLLAQPRLLFRGRFEEPARPDWPRNYDVARDGRFLMIRQTYMPTLPELVVILGWRGQTLMGSPN